MVTETSVVQFGVTPLQHAMLAESVAAGRPWVNVEQIVCFLDDEVIDRDLLQEAWDHVEQRHEMLRTLIVWDDLAEPMHRVQVHARITITVSDRTAMDADERADALEAWLTDDRNVGVDVHRSPAMRLHLFVDGPRRAVLVWTFHHTMLDGRSFTIVLQDLLEAYDARRRGTTLVPTPTAVPRGLQTTWRPSPGSIETPLNLTSGNNCGESTCHSTSTWRWEVGAWVPEPTDAIDRSKDAFRARSSSDSQRKRARSTATVGSALLVAWAIVLSRYTGQSRGCLPARLERAAMRWRTPTASSDA